LSRQVIDQVVRIASETLEDDHHRAPKQAAAHTRRAKSEG
jgi:hypothetical protein